MAEERLVYSRRTVLSLIVCKAERSMTEGRIYLDFNASTPVAPEAAAVLKSLLIDGYGNPSSPHWAARTAKEAVERARNQVASLIGAKPDEIAFTSGGTESANMAIKGLFFKLGLPFHIVTTAIEHPATLMPCKFLERLGADVTIVGVRPDGRVDPAAIADAIRPETKLIAVMHANNETGVIQPVEEIGAIARKAGAMLYVDAAQSVGKIPVNVRDLGADLLSIAGHKLYAPKGVGALYIRRGVELESLMHGAGHESGRRAGTEAVPMIAALGMACELAREFVPAMRGTVGKLTDEFWRRLKSTFGDNVVLHGDSASRLPNTLFVSFLGRSGPDLLAKTPLIAASTGSACHTGEVKPSPVLTAMGVPPEVCRGAVRFSLGRTTTPAEIESAVEMLKVAVGDG
jgi:cysteine desulfurase